MEIEKKRVIIEEMLHTRDINIYLDCLIELRDDYLIILSIKDTPGNKMSESTFNKIKYIGFSNLKKELWRTYIGVINCGNVVFDECGEEKEQPIHLSEIVNGVELLVTSRSYKQGNVSEIFVNGEDFSLNCRGWNIVVFDFETNKVIDSVTYDGFADKQTFYHMDFYFCKSFYDKNFFLSEKNRQPWVEMFSKSYFSNREIDCVEVCNGIIEPLKMVGEKNYGGICDEKFNFIAGNHKFTTEFEACYKVERNELDYIDDTVIFGGIMFEHPGHMIVEFFAVRMWWVLEHPEKNNKIAIIELKGNNKMKFIYEFMDAVNIPKERILLIEKPTKFKKIIVPEQSLTLFRGVIPYEYTRKFGFVFDYIKKNCIPAKYKKIYVSKLKTCKSNIIGENYFIDFFRQRGYEIIYPEDYTVKEKIGIFFGAEEVVSQYGTNTLYAAFCKPTVKLTLLTRVANATFGDQAIINQVSGIKDIKVVDVDIGFLHKDFVFGINLMGITNEFKRYVKSVFNEELQISTQDSLKNSLYNYLSYFPEYYSKPQLFNRIKNQKMLKVLQMMSEVFLGKEFDTSGLDLLTTEDNLQKQVKHLTDDLNLSKKRVTELENSDVYKTAKLLETINVRLEKQILEMRDSLQAMQDKQAKIDELTNLNSALADKNAELEKKLLRMDYAYGTQTKELDRIRENTESLYAQLIDVQSENERLFLKNSELQKQVSSFENSYSYRITRSLRSIAGFILRLFGRTK